MRHAVDLSPALLPADFSAANPAGAGTARSTSLEFGSALANIASSATFSSIGLGDLVLAHDHEVGAMPHEIIDLLLGMGPRDDREAWD